MKIDWRVVLILQAAENNLKKAKADQDLQLTKIWVAEMASTL